MSPACRSQEGRSRAEQMPDRTSELGSDQGALCDPGIITATPGLGGQRSEAG